MSAADHQVLVDGLALGESPRWHDGRLWLCDWVAGEVVAVDGDGAAERVLAMTGFPFSIDWLPDGRLVVVSSTERAVLRQEPDGGLVVHARLGPLADFPWNEIVVGGDGTAYVNTIGFDLMAGAEPGPGSIAAVAPDGSSRLVAGELAFPNGMALTPDGSTLLVAESYGKRITAFAVGAGGDLRDRRLWADLGDGCPDGICLDAEGACWYADVPNRRCVRVAEGGEVLATVELDRGCFACMLGGPDGRTLFVVAAAWAGPGGVDGARTGQVVAVPVSVPHAGRP